MNQGGMYGYGLYIHIGVPAVGAGGVAVDAGPGVVEDGPSEWNGAKRSPFGGV
jgi:hypothetical protein